MSDTGLTAEELEDLQRIVSDGQVNRRTFRASRFQVGDTLVAKLGPPVVGKGTNSDVLEVIAKELHLTPGTLRRCRMMAHRWRPHQRQPVLDHQVYVPVTVMHLVALGDSATTGFDQEAFDRKVRILLDAMAAAAAAEVLEVTETDYLKALRKAPSPSRQPGAQSEHKAVVSTVHQFQAQRPEARAAILGAVKADEEAKRSIAAAYLMERPALARAVLREEPDLATLAAQEVREAGQKLSREDQDAATLHELVQVLGGDKPSDELLLAEWHEDFANALTRFSRFIHDWYPADTVADKADEDLIQVITHLSRDVAKWAATITDSRKPGLRLVGSQTR
ncbi:hypothetical protein ACWCYK_31130 [Streptomyces lydicamycinicus]